MFLVNISPRGIGGFSEEGMEGQLGFSIICGFSGNNSSSNRCNACIQRMPAEPFKSNCQLALYKLSASLVMNRCAQGFNSQRDTLWLRFRSVLSSQLTFGGLGWEPN